MNKRVARILQKGGLFWKFFTTAIELDQIFISLELDDGDTTNFGGNKTTELWWFCKTTKLYSKYSANFYQNVVVLQIWCYLLPFCYKIVEISTKIGGN